MILILRVRYNESPDGSQWVSTGNSKLQSCSDAETLRYSLPGVFASAAAVDFEDDFDDGFF